MRRTFHVTLILALLCAVCGTLQAQSHLKELNKELVKIAAKVSPSVVAIEIPPAPGAKAPLKPEAAKPGQDPDWPFEGPNPFRRFRARFTPSAPTIRASGVILSADGAILTSAHHFRGRKDAKVTVTLADGRRFDGKLAGKDLRTGLAVVKIDAEGLKTVKLAEKSPPVGSLVVAVSNTPGLGNSVRLGMISGTDRVVTGAGPGLIGSGMQYTGLLQVTTPVDSPDLGGLVADLDGNLVGMIHSAMTGRRRGPRQVVAGAPGVQIYQMEAFGRSTVRGVSFAMPAHVIKRVFEPLKKGESVKWGYLGIYFAFEKGTGLRVKDVIADGPAQKAELRKDDVIRSLKVPDAEEVAFKGDARDLKTFAKTIGWTPPGTVVTLGVTRDGKEIEVKVTLGEAPEVPERQAMVMPQEGFQWRWEGEGVPLADFWKQFEKRRAEVAAPLQLGVMTEPAEGGVRVAGVIGGTPADKARLRAGDIILRVGETPTPTAEALKAGILKCKPGDKVAVALRRDGKDLIVEVTLERPPGPVVRFRRFRLGGGAYLGINGEDTEDGLKITKVLPGSSAERAGFKPGDVVVRAGEKDIAGLADLREVIRKHKPGDEITISVKRDHEELDLKAKLGGHEPDIWNP